MNGYEYVGITETIEHNENLKSFRIDKDMYPQPGQFAMIWLPEYQEEHKFINCDGEEVVEACNEKPISFSNYDEFTVRKVGHFTDELFKKEKGDKMHVRGPFGNNFDQGTTHNSEYKVLIGGGCGIAPMLFDLVYDCSTAKAVFAADSKKSIPYLENLVKENSEDLVIVTEDGSYGEKGLITDIEIPKVANARYHICGPEIMMKFTAEKLVKEGVKEDKIYLSMERYMKCAVGICGNCAFDGYRVCADGPVFQYSKIGRLPHFNKFGRSRTGELLPLKVLHQKC